jgi:hypothetical protein
VTTGLLWPLSNTKIPVADERATAEGPSCAVSQVFLWPSYCHVTRGSPCPSVEETLAAYFDWTQWHREHGHPSTSLVEEALGALGTWNQLSQWLRRSAGNGAASSPTTVSASRGFGAAASVVRSGSASYWTACYNFPKRFPRSTTGDWRRDGRDASFGASCVHRHPLLEAGTTNRNFASVVAHATSSSTVHMASSSGYMTRTTTRGGSATRMRT